MSAAPLTLGTAGHIDHGKTMLVRELTGVDTDRLPEERARGISIALGYAQLILPSGRHLSVIDVPGHERFVRTMVAGATGIDLYLMTVAADDGVMPQTREHAAVLRALGVGTGIVAITKCDLADPGPSIAAAGELLPGAETIAVSSRTGDGLDELRAALERAAATTTSRADNDGPPRLHIDRAFTIRGAGTVVTGTLWSGTIAKGDQLRILPGNHRTRVRAVQVHDEQRDQAEAGQRVAVNLVGISLHEVARGSVLTAPQSELRESHVLEVEPDFEPEPSTRVQIHHGTRESPGRLRPRKGTWRLELEHALAALPGDRFVARQIAPPDTLGGGMVKALGPSSPRFAAGRPSGPRVVVATRPSAADQADQGSTPPPLSDSAQALEQRLKQAGLEPPTDNELNAEADLRALRQAGRAVRVSRTLHYHPVTIENVRNRVIEMATRDGSITLSGLRDELGTSRKFAQALLEHLDSEHTTIRRGEEHFLRRSANRPNRT